MEQSSSNGFDFDKLRVASPCSVPWESMDGDERSRLCHSCNLDVYNIAGLSTSEIENLIANRTTRLCIRLFRRGDGKVLTRDCPTGVRTRRRTVTKFAGAIFASLLGLVTISFAQKDSSKSDDSARAKIERTSTASDAGEIKGTIFDPNGALVPAAKVKILVSKKVKYSATSNDEGKFSIPGITPSEGYKVEITGPGFKTFVLNKLRVNSGEQLNLEIPLQVDGETVVGLFLDEPLLDTTSPSITYTITRRQIESLPINK